MLRLNNDNNLISYFSMEIGVDPNIPTYSGGLGILAGDTLRSFADLGVPAVAVTLLSEFGYFTQKIDEEKNQNELFPRWDVEKYLEKLEEEAIMEVGNEQIHISLWRYMVEGEGGERVPIIYLDTNHPNNRNEDRKLTQRMYPSNKAFRLKQEMLLGIGGVKALNVLGYYPTIFHMNEGHPAFLVLELLRQLFERKTPNPFATVRDLCVFTTHTPVPAGHDRFESHLAQEMLGPYNEILKQIPEAFDDKGLLNMSFLAAHMSDKINGVAKKHAEVSQAMFPNYPVNSITNGIHHQFWTSDSFSELFDQKLPGWREDPTILLHALRLSTDHIHEKHQVNKSRLTYYINQNYDKDFKDDVFTIGYARRITRYKRPDLLFYDLEKLNEVCEKQPIQIVYAGKAHYEDTVGKSLIHEVLSLSDKLKDNIKLVYIENYDINLAKLIIPGVDLWLNTPMRPLEASGTSGMKASLNGVPNFSVLDGWWIEGAVEGVTGWTIGPYPEQDESDEIVCVDCDDSDNLYHKLQSIILPMYYEHPEEFDKIRKYALAIHGSYFNTHRMVQQYIIKSYLD